MRLGLFNNGWWGPACEALKRDGVMLPIAQHESGNAYAADLPSRLANGMVVADILRRDAVDALIDNSGTGLGFVAGSGGLADLKLLHEIADKPLVSHFIDPMVTAFQGLPWDVAWRCLQSRNWIKAVWDRAQVSELRRFGVGNVLHLPMAAPNRPYDTRPLDSSKCRPVVSFVGGQNTAYFHSNASVPPASLLPGVLAHARRESGASVCFADAYYDQLRYADPPRADEPIEHAIQKTAEYFTAKLFFNAALCIRNRDRFVLHLHRSLGDTFQLIGRGWDSAYGLPTRPQLPTADDYFQHFRDVAININLVNGNAETGLNMRHFEITAAGGFMLCHDQPELAQHFTVGKECDVFRSENELVDKVRYYLSHPTERIAIAQAGQRRTLSQHLYSHRLQHLLHMVATPPPPVEFSRTTFEEDIRRFVPEADVLLDCGANIGQTAEGLRKLYPTAGIYCFEPVSACHVALTERCERVGAVVVRRALADYDGRGTIQLTSSPECHSLLPYEPGNPCAQWNWVVGTEEIDVCTLDTWCKNENVDPRRISLLKMDLQGAELLALYGAKSVLKHARAVYLEASFVEIYKSAPLFSEVDRFLCEAGYVRQAVYPSDQPYFWANALYVKR